jgi:hypothetical protein
MSRPLPLTSMVSARPGPAAYHQLTPRTPYSRPDRDRVEDYTEIELEQVTDSDHDDDHEELELESEQQTNPLLSSSTSDNFPLGEYRRGDGLGVPSASGKSRERDQQPLNTVLSRLPLVAGILFAALLLLLAFLSFQDPDILPRYFGVSLASEASPISSDSTESSSTDMPPSHNVLSYENYTNFPLLPSQYSAECYKLHIGFVSHGEYWEPHRMGVLDVVHHDGKHAEGQRMAVCTSTITYMLDGEVGLLADLALMAQAAALAREVGLPFVMNMRLLMNLNK